MFDLSVFWLVLMVTPFKLGSSILDLSGIVGKSCTIAELLLP
jgi:hypothetical protein